MERITEEFIDKLEKALDIKFYEWQRNYLLDIPAILDMRMTGRRTGKTLAYIIKKLYETDKPLYVITKKETVRESDWWCVARSVEEAGHCGAYENFFRHELKGIYEELNSKGLTTRPVIFDEHALREYMGVDLSGQPDRTGYISNQPNKIGYINKASCSNKGDINISVEINKDASEKIYNNIATKIL